MLRTPRPATIIANAQRAWRQSLQVRVVTITLATSGVLVASFGVLVSNQITNGILESRTERAQELVVRGTDRARPQLDASIGDADQPGANVYVERMVSDLGSGDQGIDVAIISADDTTAAIEGASYPNRDAHTVIPQRLKDAVERDGFVRQRLDLDLEGDGARLYLVFGRQVAQRWGNLQVYYFFPLDQEVGAAALVRNTITITGTALVLMLALVAALVTRMVVNPVRVAARTAQRLSNGLLDQRMDVKGEDDLAALAASFNHMAENLQRHILRLEEMSRLQRRFTSDVSHELRTPLTTVRMAADLIFTEREKFDPPVARSAELLQAELDRFEGLLTELLEISRFDAGFAVLDAEPANLGPLVARVIDRLTAVATRAGVAIEFDPSAEPIVAEVDVRRVERILRNLIGNAIEHGDGKPVRVRLAERSGAVAVTVRDHGVGLKPGEEKLVFSRFWRADPSRARHTGGTGLGLSISVEDARLHGGWLEAWGEPGRGAQFRLTLPVKAGDRLTSSPLRLVPTDFRRPADAKPIWRVSLPAARADEPVPPEATVPPEVTIPPAAEPVPEDGSVPEPAGAVERSRSDG
jgi:two-component system, OmpR family, sensor histidine kinase MtrB